MPKGRIPQRLKDIMAQRNRIEKATKFAITMRHMQSANTKEKGLQTFTPDIHKAERLRTQKYW